MTATSAPIATYRLQLNRSLRFADARRLVPYLQTLGISDLYASPVFAAGAGSTHGYDVTDPNRLNPELGTVEEFEALSAELEAREMGLLLDIVPNHMSASQENVWWMDVLRHGAASPCEAFFDINWNPDVSPIEGRILLGMLGRPYGEALEAQEIRLCFGECGFYLQYYDRYLPVDPRSYPLILRYRLEGLQAELDGGHAGLQEYLAALRCIEALPDRTSVDVQARSQRWTAWESCQRRLWHACTRHPEIAAFVQENVRRLNGTADEPESFDLLDGLVRAQAYRLAFWKTAQEKLNYRRFFNINDLVGLRTEDPRVFDATHRLVRDLVRDRRATGLRIDHVDGLRDPLAYLQRLQQQCSRPGEGTYVVVEKILLGTETLPENWPVAGTTGYDFLRMVNGLFIEPTGLEQLVVLYRRLTGEHLPFEELAARTKQEIAVSLFPGEMNSLEHRLLTLAEQDRHACDLPTQELRAALRAVTACLPVYRTYTTAQPVRPADRRSVEHALRMARRLQPELGDPALGFLRRLLLLELPVTLTERQREEWREFVLSWQQITGPITAKGLEDTALYIYNPLISLNEVGGVPGEGALFPEDFHRFVRERAARWPLTLNCTATHDTKRGEDARARIDVLSELPAEWEERLDRWREWSHDRKQWVDHQPVPGPDVEVQLYQSLLGSWPGSPAELPSFKERFIAYMLKARREAKTQTGWLHPNEPYEAGLVHFIEELLDEKNRRFLADFEEFQRKVAFFGAFNSLAQVLLKITAPGVPDFYRGTELWDLSFVDPDNRRPVDMALRVRLLEELCRREAEGRLPLLGELLASWPDGRIKLYLIHKGLQFRRAHSLLFAQGEYLALVARGPRRENVVAFARRQRHRWALTAVPRLLASLVPVRSSLTTGEEVWEDTVLLLPPDAPPRWQCILTDGELQTETPGELRLADLFRHGPVALLGGRMCDSLQRSGGGTGGK